MLLIGLKWAFEKQLLGIGKSFINSLFVIFWTSICMGFFYGTLHTEWCVWLSNEYLAGHFTWKDWNWATSFFSA